MFCFALQQFLNPKGGCSTGCKPVLLSIVVNAKSDFILLKHVNSPLEKKNFGKSFFDKITILKRSPAIKFCSLKKDFTPSQDLQW